MRHFAGEESAEKEVREWSRFIHAMLPAVLEAGAFAAASQGTVRNVGKAADSVDVVESDLTKRRREAKTVIDEAVQERLLIAARAALGTRPIGLDAEENTLSKKLFSDDQADATLVIDPIDGTLEYLEGSPAYSVCLGVVSSGKVSAAVVYFPARRELFLLDGDRAWACECADGKVISKKPLEAPRAVSGNVVYVNSRVSPEARACLSKKFSVVDDAGSVTWSEALLKTIAGEYRAAAFVRPQVRDVLIGAMLQSLPDAYALDASGKEITWPEGGRIPEAVFGFGAFPEEISSCFV